MNVENPKSLKEWKAYAEALEGESLRDKAVAANSVEFLQMLQEEGYGPQEIHSIFVFIARRFAETGQRPPGDGLYDLFSLMNSVPPLSE